MRVYFEKPRTSTGWKGFINDPFMDDSFHIEQGMQKARPIFIGCQRIGFACGDRSSRPNCLSNTMVI